MIAGTRPTRSANQPKKTAPKIWPTKPTDKAAPIDPGARCHGRTSTGIA